MSAVASKLALIRALVSTAHTVGDLCILLAQLTDGNRARSRESRTQLNPLEGVNAVELSSQSESGTLPLRLASPFEL